MSEGLPRKKSIAETIKGKALNAAKAAVLGGSLVFPNVGHAESAPSGPENTPDTEARVPKQSEDPNLLVVQQQIRDLQERGEMKIQTEMERARGVREDMQKVLTDGATSEQLERLEAYQQTQSPNASILENDSAWKQANENEQDTPK
jgi:hypothetical protein